MKINFKKSGGLVPVIIQNTNTLQVLMLGYMNEEAFEKTRTEGRVTFFSRSKNRLWTKGETSGNYLTVSEILEDCDNDTLLIKAIPQGPTCHTGATTCFAEETPKGFIYELEKVIEQRITCKTEGS
ncbi:MAG: phosphoribosyl-AMP cyclohydrolase, partial [Petrimonas sp.]|nr:phosphoribosyl-AMP cyclohydrolase [Petrimonas sp.]